MLSREDHGTDSDNDWVHFQHNGGSLVNNYFHDFGHTCVDQSSCIHGLAEPNWS